MQMLWKEVVNFKHSCWWSHTLGKICLRWTGQACTSTETPSWRPCLLFLLPSQCIFSQPEWSTSHCSSWRIVPRPCLSPVINYMQLPLAGFLETIGSRVIWLHLFFSILTSFGAVMPLSSIQAKAVCHWCWSIGHVLDFICSDFNALKISESALLRINSIFKTFY